MLVALVQMQVQPEHLAAFTAAMLDNARHSLQEPGVLRFDVIQQEDDPTRFVVIEVFRDAEAQLAHRETAHYLRWRETVPDMLAAPRTNVRHTVVFPAEAEAWRGGASGQ